MCKDPNDSVARRTDLSTLAGLGVRVGGARSGLHALLAQDRLGLHVRARRFRDRLHRHLRLNLKNKRFSSLHQANDASTLRNALGIFESKLSLSFC